MTMVESFVAVVDVDGFVALSANLFSVGCRFVGFHVPFVFCVLVLEIISVPYSLECPGAQSDGRTASTGSLT